MVTATVVMLICFQLEHFVADYLLQPKWVLRGKGDVRRSGGYVHAGLHCVGSLPALLTADPRPLVIAALIIAEFVVHYLIDFTKADLSVRSQAGPDTATYWALHSVDQLLHQLTYAALIFLALA